MHKKGQVRYTFSEYFDIMTAPLAMKMYYTKNTLFPDLLIFFIIKWGCASL